MGVQFYPIREFSQSNRHIDGRSVEAMIGGGGTTGNRCDDVLMFLYAEGFVNISVQLDPRNSLLARGGEAVGIAGEAGCELELVSDMAV